MVQYQGPVPRYNKYGLLSSPSTLVHLDWKDSYLSQVPTWVEDRYFHLTARVSYGSTVMGFALKKPADVAGSALPAIVIGTFVAFGGVLFG